MERQLLLFSLLRLQRRDILSWTLRRLLNRLRRICLLHRLRLRMSLPRWPFSARMGYRLFLLHYLNRHYLAIRPSVLVVPSLQCRKGCWQLQQTRVWNSRLFLPAYGLGSSAHLHCPRHQGHLHHRDSRWNPEEVYLYSNMDCRWQLLISSLQLWLLVLQLYQDFHHYWHGGLLHGPSRLAPGLPHQGLGCKRHSCGLC